MRYRYERKGNGSLKKKAVVWTKEEHGIDADSLDEQAVRITRILHDAGFESYIVGGAVRDLILGKRPKDFDIVTAATPAQIKRFIRNTRIIGRRFRLAHVSYDAKIYEVATFRSIKEGTTSNTFGTIEEDVQRRDFTMNALFYDPSQETVIDYVGGVPDIKGRVLRPVIPLNSIFRDDPVRMIRAVKYAAGCGFEIPLRIRWKIKKDAPLLLDIPISRLTEELSKIIHSQDAAVIVDGLFGTNLWRYLQPKADLAMREDAGFKAAYLRGFSELGAQEKKGAHTAALVRLYLEGALDWKRPDVGAVYKDALVLARQFVAPAALPRFELEAGLRLLFAEHGVSTRHIPQGDPRRPRRARPSGAARPPE